MASSNRMYTNKRIMGENPESYVPGGFHVIHLGDMLNDRYLIFRKLGTGSQSTIWLARDNIAPERRYVAIKVFGAITSQTEIKLDKLLQPLRHPGKQHIEMALDSFTVHGPNGDHFCKVLEPLAGSLYAITESAFEGRAELNAPESWRGKVLDGDTWSEKLAKRACYQILLGLDYLHAERIAHRDIQPHNVCLALEYGISLLSENEIQKAVWPAESEEGEIELEQSTETKTGTEADADEIANARKSSTDESSSDSASDSDDESWAEWLRTLEERRKATEEKWQMFETGNKLAVPHSIEWNKANFLLSREDIELLQRSDGKPIQSYEIRYTIESSPLIPDSALHLTESSRIVLVDLGFACSFEECEKLPLHTLSDYKPPEAVIGIPVTHKADIFCAGLLFWEIVMLRRLVETRFNSDDPERVYSKNRLLHDLVQRIGPFPSSMRVQWVDADEFTDSEGIALDIQEHDGESYGPDDFEYGDIWHQARNRKPLDMSDSGLKRFVSLIQEMLQLNPASRPSTTALLEHEWFRDLK